MEGSPYSHDELFNLNPQRAFSDDATEAAFLLGGIGTGNVSIGSRGHLRDWELFNNPGKGNYLPYSFFAIRAQAEGEEAIAKVLEARIHSPYSRSHGYYSGDLAGLPRLHGATMRGEYPFVEIDFHDDDLPGQVSMEAFTPFIPLNAGDSGVPGAVLRYKVRNNVDRAVEVTIAGSLANAVGMQGYELFFYPDFAGNPRNDYREEESVRGIFFSNPDLDGGDLRYGSMALVTRDTSVTAKESWLDGAWWDGAHDFWDDFCDDGKLDMHSTAPPIEGVLSAGSKLKVGSLGIYHTMQPGEERVFEFFLGWHFPNRPQGWLGHIINADPNAGKVIRNYYSTLFADAWHAASYLASDIERLEKGSRDFHDAFFGSTLPDYVLDAAAANITVLRSTTCFRIEDGTLLGWEGGFDRRGSCEGSCTHVWNYAQTVAFLFPELERTTRRVEFLLETDEAGNMAFRTNQVFGGPKWAMLPATDGQMGTIVRLYREWKLSGDDEFLRQVWQSAARALDFAFTYWDADGDFVLENQQHNTYDVEFYGPNSLTNSIFFAALKAGAEMAEYLGEGERAQRYRSALAEGSARMDEMLWGGEYYIQKIDDVNAHRYQYGTGCLSDQLFGQMLAHVVGLGHILPKEHVREAIASIYRYNFRSSMKDHDNVQRTYALNDEKGLLVCTWPHGGRPRLPFPYSDEVWTGMEYQVAAHLIYEGFVEEGLTLVKAVRERYDGYKRNPWNEVECGNHYARSLASWAAFLALGGFRADMVEGTLDFAPLLNADHFSTFWSTGKAWGIYRQWTDPQTAKRKWRIETLYGDLGAVTVNGHPLPETPSAQAEPTVSSPG